MKYKTYISYVECPVIPFIPENASREWLLNEFNRYKELSEDADDDPLFKNFYDARVDLISDALEKRYHVRLKNRASRQN